MDPTESGEHKARRGFTSFFSGFVDDEIVEKEVEWGCAL